MNGAQKIQNRGIGQWASWTGFLEPILGAASVDLKKKLVIE